MSVSPLLSFSEAFASSLAVTSTRRPQGSATVADSERAQANNPVSAAAPESLIESEQLLAAYFGASRVGVCILDTDFRFLAINRTLAEMNGILAEAHLGKSVREVLGDFAELVEPQFNRVLATQQPVLNLEISFMLPNRTEPAHWIEQYIPIKGATGKVTQIGIVAVEITERKRLEESLRGVSESLREEKKQKRTTPVGVSSPRNRSTVIRHHSAAH